MFLYSSPIDVRERRPRRQFACAERSAEWNTRSGALVITGTVSAGIAHLTVSRVSKDISRHTRSQAPRMNDVYSLEKNPARIYGLLFFFEFLLELEKHVAAKGCVRRA